MDDAWEPRALCRHVGPDPFFAEGTCRPALALCQRCPVQMECLVANVEEKQGVWACSERCRKRLRKLMKSPDYTGPEQLLAFARASNAQTIGHAANEVPVLLWAALGERQLASA